MSERQYEGPGQARRFEGPVKAEGCDLVLQWPQGKEWLGSLSRAGRAEWVASQLNRVITFGTHGDPAWRDAPDAEGWWWLWSGGEYAPFAVYVKQSVLSERTLIYRAAGDMLHKSPQPGQKWLALTPPAPPEGG